MARATAGCAFHFRESGVHTGREVNGDGVRKVVEIHRQRLPITKGTRDLHQI